MSFLTLKFILFFLCFICVYYIIPNNKRYILIFVGSIIFYGCASIRFLIFLAYTICITYFAGIVLAVNKNKKVLGLFIFINLLPLLFLKYANIIIRNTDLILPLGLSFYIFQSCTYIFDAYKEKICVEKNIIRYASFVAFFPTLLSGPIQKSRELLPQISNPQKVNYDEVKKGILLIVWGAFEKELVANYLFLIVDRIFSDYLSYHGGFYILAAISFSLYIYADFSSYSDLARGIAKIMGINIGKNFNNPYLSKSTREFWNRWHVSLNSWFIENLYIPLGGNRKGLARKYVNILIVFLISGIWHGSYLHFIVWGILNGILVVIGYIIEPIETNFYKKYNIDSELESLCFIKRCITFILITLTWIFFYNGIEESFYIINKIFTTPLYFYFDENLLSIAGEVTITFEICIFVIAFIIIQLLRTKESYYYIRFKAQPEWIQSFFIAALLLIIFIAANALNVSVNTQYIYFNF